MKKLSWIQIRMPSTTNNEPTVIPFGIHYFIIHHLPPGCLQWYHSIITINIPRWHQEAQLLRNIAMYSQYMRQIGHLSKKVSSNIKNDLLKCSIHTNYLTYSTSSYQFTDLIYCLPNLFVITISIIRYSAFAMITGTSNTSSSFLSVNIAKANIK